MSRSLRVLIVEDEYFVATYVADLMEDWGHKVMAMCATGEDAIEHLKRGGVELAILDIKLKGDLTGVDVAEVARTQGVTHVFLSGSGDPATRSAARATDPLAFLQKPVNERQLSAVLSEVAAETLGT
ncbi:CheY-like chemotaxis protein [Methylobacterium sp. OAE515]